MNNTDRKLSVLAFLEIAEDALSSVIRITPQDSDVDEFAYEARRAIEEAKKRAHELR